METVSLVLDNGASSLKMGFSHEDRPKLIPNCVTRYELMEDREGGRVGGSPSMYNNFISVFFL